MAAVPRQLLVTALAQRAALTTVVVEAVPAQTTVKTAGAPQRIRIMAVVIMETLGMAEIQLLQMAEVVQVDLSSGCGL